MALSSEQVRNAAIIMSVGRSLGASPRDILIALMVALQESSLRNLSYGDRDSVGLFQQRAGWAPYSVRMNPAASTRMFFTGGMKPGTPGLFDIRNRASMRLTAAAQAVQRSGFPSAYAKHESTARGLMGRSGASVATSGGFYRPVRGGTLTSGFGPRSGSAGISRLHHGVDIGITVGSPVYAAQAGRVVRVTTGGNYGTRIEIAHEGKVWTLYAHLSGTSVRVGQAVMAGQLIGRSGGRRGAPGAGNSTGPHLHFEVRTGSNRYGNARDPMQWLNGSTTPTASVSAQTTVVPADITDLLGEETALAEQTMSKPYLYSNPIDAFSDSFIDMASGDPMAGLSGGATLPSTELSGSIQAEQLVRDLAEAGV